MTDRKGLLKLLTCVNNATLRAFHPPWLCRRKAKQSLGKLGFPEGRELDFLKDSAKKWQVRYG